MSVLANKKYLKPRANQVIDPTTAPNVTMASDLVEFKGWVALVMPECRDKGAFNPSTSFFAISDPLPLNVGDRILVDTYSGYSELTYVKAKTGRMIEVYPYFVNTPKIMGEVIKIIGEKTTLIDTDYDLSKEEDYLLFKNNKREVTEEEKQNWENLKIVKRRK